MNRLCALSRILMPIVAAFSFTLLLVPYASAITLIDPIIGVANATGPCSSNGLTTGGGTICAGNTAAFSLTALEHGTQKLQAVVGTQTSPVYLVNNDTGMSTFSLLFSGALAFNHSWTVRRTAVLLAIRARFPGRWAQ